MINVQTYNRLYHICTHQYEQRSVHAQVNIQAVIYIKQLHKRLSTLVFYVRKVFNTH